MKLPKEFKLYVNPHEGKFIQTGKTVGDWDAIVDALINMRNLWYNEVWEHFYKGLDEEAHSKAMEDSHIKMMDEALKKAGVEMQRDIEADLKEGAGKPDLEEDILSEEKGWELMVK